MADLECGFVGGQGVRAGDWLLQYGPTAQVDIGFDPVWSATGSVPPVAGVTQVHALIDTGAFSSCIDDDLALSLNLPIVNRQRVGGVGGVYTANMYAAQIHFSQLPDTIYGDFAGVKLTAAGQPHQALIGRDFLQGYRMVYDGTTGRVTISHPAQQLGVMRRVRGRVLRFLQRD